MPPSLTCGEKSSSHASLSKICIACLNTQSYFSAMQAVPGGFQADVAISGPLFGLLIVLGQASLETTAGGLGVPSKFS